VPVYAVLRRRLDKRDMEAANLRPGAA